MGRGSSSEVISRSGPGSQGRVGEAGERRMLRAPVWGEGVGRRKTQVRAGMMAAGLTYIPGVLVILFRVLGGLPECEQESSDVSEPGQERATTCLGPLLSVGAL